MKQIGRPSKLGGGWDVACNPNSFFETKSRHFEEYMHNMELKLTGYVSVKQAVKFRCSDLFGQNPFEYSLFFSRKIAIFSFARDI